MSNVELNSTTIPLYQVQCRVKFDKNSVVTSTTSSSNRHVILHWFVLGCLSSYYLTADYKLGISDILLKINLEHIVGIYNNNNNNNNNIIIIIIIIIWNVRT
jgi:hypothetical protein